MKIGVFAKLLGVSSDTLRYYEKNGLLSGMQRSDSGYRHYTQEHVKQVKFILRAKSVGFTLSEIKDLLSITVDKNAFSCEEVKVITELKRDHIREKIAQLQKFEMSLSTLINACCGSDESAMQCSILSILED